MPPLQQLDSRVLPARRGELLLVTCVRNEALRLPHFLDYYRKLGIDRILAIDNESDDGTTEWLLAQPDAHVFLARGSYAGSHCGVLWMNEVLSRHAAGHWTLTVDADELLVYPDCERLGLGALTGHLERSGADALACFLLDMYSDCPIRDTHYRAGTPFLATCPYFDADSYQKATQPPYTGLPMRGGVRQRVFWAGRAHRGNPPVLYKTPLVKWAPGLSYKASTHLIDGVRHGQATGALLHFKLFSDMVRRAPAEAVRGEHWDGAAQYDAYASVLADDPALCAWYPGSVRYEDSQQLERLGLLRRPPAYP